MPRTRGIAPIRSEIGTLTPHIRLSLEVRDVYDVYNATGVKATKSALRRLKPLAQSLAESLTRV